MLNPCMTLEFKIPRITMKVKFQVNHKIAIKVIIMVQLTTEQRVLDVTQLTPTPNVTAVQNEAKTL